MTNTQEKQNGLSRQDIRILLDLQEGKLPIREVKLSNGATSEVVLAGNSPVYLDEAFIDVDTYEKKCTKQENAFSFTPTVSREELATRRDLSWGNEHIKMDTYTTDDEPNKTKLGVQLNGFLYTLDTEDLIKAARNLSVPDTLSNRLKGTFSNPFKHNVEMNGVTCAAPSGAYFSFEDRLVPRYIALTSMNNDAENAWRRKNVEFRVNALKRSADHISKVSKKAIYPSLAELIKTVNHKIPDLHGHTNAYDSCGERFVDEKKRVVLGFSHYLATSFHLHLTDYPETGSVGYLKIRPVLGTGEIATPEIIQRYVGGLK